MLEIKNQHRAGLGPGELPLIGGQSISGDGVILTHILWEQGRGLRQPAQSSQQEPRAVSSPTRDSKKETTANQWPDFAPYLNPLQEKG